MKIHVLDIPEEGMLFDADSTRASWLRQVFAETLGVQAFAEGDTGRLSLQLLRSHKNVTVIGGIILLFHPICDKCLAHFKKQEQVTIHLIMLPSCSSGPAKTKKEDEDEDVSFYKNDEIDLRDVVRESVILARHMVDICSDDCKGLCSKCGKNLNKGKCACREKNETNSPFAVIKTMKKLKKTKK